MDNMLKLASFGGGGPNKTKQGSSDGLFYAENSGTTFEAISKNEANIHLV